MSTDLNAGIERNTPADFSQFGSVTPLGSKTRLVDKGPPVPLITAQILPRLDGGWGALAPVEVVLRIGSDSGQRGGREG